MSKNINKRVNESLKAYMMDGPQSGILRIYNIQTGKTLLVTSDNLTGDTAKIRFQLDMGTFSHQELQDAYEKIGLELFAIEVFVISDGKKDLQTLFNESKSNLMNTGVSFYR